MYVSDIDEAAVGDFIQTLKVHLHELKLASRNDDQFRIEIRRLETQMASPNPIRNVVYESLRTIRNLLEGCAGSLIASSLLFEIGKLLR